MDPKEIVREGYNTSAAEYLAGRAKDSEDVRLLWELVRRLPKGAKVLDAGCGAGVPVARFLSRFFEVTGVDFAEAQIELARGLVPEARFVCEDMTALAFPEGSFDAICSYYAIIHIPREKHRQLLIDFHRMLRPSGLALLCMGANDVPDDLQESFFGARMYWSHYDANTNLKMLKECGFNIMWSRIVPDPLGGAHPFVLARKS